MPFFILDFLSYNNIWYPILAKVKQVLDWSYLALCVVKRMHKYLLTIKCDAFYMVSHNSQCTILAIFSSYVPKYYQKWKWTKIKHPYSTITQWHSPKTRATIPMKSWKDLHCVEDGNCGMSLERMSSWLLPWCLWVWHNTSLLWMYSVFLLEENTNITINHRMNSEY